MILLKRTLYYKYTLITLKFKTLTKVELLLFMSL